MRLRISTTPTPSRLEPPSSRRGFFITALTALADVRWKFDPGRSSEFVPQLYNRRRAWLQRARGTHHRCDRNTSATLHYSFSAPHWRFRDSGDDLQASL